LHNSLHVKHKKDDYFRPSFWTCKKSHNSYHSDLLNFSFPRDVENWFEASPGHPAVVIRKKKIRRITDRLLLMIFQIYLKLFEDIGTLQSQDSPPTLCTTTSLSTACHAEEENGVQYICSSSCKLILRPNSIFQSDKSVGLTGPLYIKQKIMPIPDLNHIKVRK